MNEANFRKNQEGFTESLVRRERLNKNLLGLVDAETFMIWIMPTFTKTKKVYLRALHIKNV